MRHHSGSCKVDAAVDVMKRWKVPSLRHGLFTGQFGRIYAYMVNVVEGTAERAEKRNRRESVASATLTQSGAESSEENHFRTATMLMYSIEADQTDR